jgi:hypothetical protein
MAYWNQNTPNDCINMLRVCFVSIYCSRWMLILIELYWLEFCCRVSCLLPASCRFLPWLSLQTWRYRRHIPWKRWLTSKEVHSVMYGLRSIERWDHRFEYHSRHDYLCSFNLRLCVRVCVGRGLAMGWSLIPRVLPTVYRIKKLKNRRRSKERSVEP